MSLSPIDFYWSVRPSDVAQDKVLTSFAQATYYINLSNLKSHRSAGVTLCGKNHYGWLRLPPADGYYDMHDSLPSRVPSEGSYRCLVDLMVHAHSGGKALVYLIDGLYEGVHNDDDAPILWDFAPFNGDWTSIFNALHPPRQADLIGLFEHYCDEETDTSDSLQ